MIKSQSGIHIWENRRKQYSFLKEITEQQKKKKKKKKQNKKPLNLKSCPWSLFPHEYYYFFLLQNSKTSQWSDFLKYIIWNGKLKRVDWTIGE